MIRKIHTRLLLNYHLKDLVQLINFVLNSTLGLEYNQKSYCNHIECLLVICLVLILVRLIQIATTCTWVWSPISHHTKIVSIVYRFYLFFFNSKNMGG